MKGLSMDEMMATLMAKELAQQMEVEKVSKLAPMMVVMMELS